MSEPVLVDIHAENALLSNLFYSTEALPLVAGRFDEADLTQEPARQLYRLMTEQYQRGESDANTLRAELERSHFDMAYLDTLGQVFPARDHTRLVAYADAIANAADLRKLASTVRNVESWLEPGANAADLRAKAINELTTGARDDASLQPIAGAAQAMREQVLAWQRGETDSSVPTGFSELDRGLKLRPDELTVIAARPSQGKSQLGFQIMHNMARWLVNSGEDGCVAIFSAEMPSKSVASRIACAAAGVDSWEVETGKASREDAARLCDHLDALGRLPLYISDKPAPTIRELLFQASLLNARKPIKGMLFDFMEQAGDENERSEELRVSAIAKGLKDIAKLLHIPVVAISQLSRAVEARSDKIPLMSDLRYSGNIEAVADAVLFLVRWEYYAERGVKLDWGGDLAEYMQPGVAMVILAKNRNGRVGSFPLAFTAKYTRFGNYAEPR